MGADLTRIRNKPLVSATRTREIFFPKLKKLETCSGPLEIHTDTAVSLSVKQVELLICLPMDSETSTASQ
jgi:hypothetical protein